MADTRTTPGTQVAFTIAGSDSSGGAGIQADLKTFTAMDVYGASAITAITAQNTTGVKKAHILDPALIEAQIDAVAGDFEINATKTGMLGNAAVVNLVAAAIKRHNLLPLVVDPVMVSRGGDSLIDDAAVKAICDRLLPLATIVTPNRLEAARLLGRSEPIDDVGGAIAAARMICQRFGAKACVVKGIRRESNSKDEAVDIYFDGGEPQEVVADWRDTKNTHGAGCTFSAAIAAALALGRALPDAVALAKAVVSEAIRQATDHGAGHGPVNHLAYLKVKK
jgi:hydroxymethylpyrimidine/phosphomethylpyrimidine kinase